MMKWASLIGSFDAEREPAPCVLEALRRHKPGIVDLLAKNRGAWTAGDWRAFFDERVGIAELDGGQAREQAEATAFDCCVAEWLARATVEPSGSERCAHCQRPLHEHDRLPFLNPGRGHVWLHIQCHTSWMAERRDQAVAALAEMGIEAPVDIT